MEETMNEEQQSFRSPPRRRRSTFFEKRESFAPQQAPNNEEPCKSPNVDPLDVGEKHNRELPRYHDLLLAEKEQWKKEVKDRRNLYHDLRQQYTMAVKASGRSRMSYSTLSGEDIEFIKGKCNINTLVESQQKLHKSVRETRALYARACELDQVILTICEDKVKEITEYIIENSTIE